MIYSLHFRTVPQRGFTLLVALIFISVILSVGLALSDVAFKQVILASTAQQSQYAFYAADSALECALEQDQVYDTFDFTSGAQSGTNAFMCEGQQISFSNPPASGAPLTRVATFSIPCPNGSGSDPIATIQVYKTATKSTLYADGFNDCNASNPNRVERGLKSFY